MIMVLTQFRRRRRWLRIVTVVALVLVVASVCIMLAHAEPSDAQQIEDMLFKRFPEMNRVLWLDENTTDFGNQKGA